MTTPIFAVADHFDTTVAIGTDKLPIKVKRFSRGEMEAFEKKWDALTGPPRGTAPLTDEQKTKREVDQLAFFEESIREAITLDPGYVVDRDVDVVNGNGLIGVFHSRKDVLSDLLVAIYTSNKLAGVIRKNSSSPRVSAIGSEASIPARGGDAQGPTAGSAGESSSASIADATAEEPDASSGETPKVH